MCILFVGLYTFECSVHAGDGFPKKEVWGRGLSELYPVCFGFFTFAKPLKMIHK